MKRVTAAAFIIALTTIAISCARDVADSTSSYQRVLDAWIRTNYGTALSPNDSGVYVLSYEQGTGKQVKDTQYVFVHYTCTDLEGNIISSNREEVNRQLGTYGVTDYYGSDIWCVGVESVAQGLEQVLLTMREGGKAKIAVPANQNILTYTGYNAFNYGTGTTVIYDFVVDSVVEDIFEYQNDQLRDYSIRHANGIDTAMEGLYYRLLSETPDCDSISDETTIKIRYIGRRLDGTVFDTNIQDTAKYYRIYSPNNDYAALEMTYYKDESNFLENATTVEGFSYAVMQMKYGDTSEVFFRSDFGYASTGSGNAIPEYCPLYFWIYVEPKDN